MIFANIIKYVSKSCFFLQVEPVTLLVTQVPVVLSELPLLLSDKKWIILLLNIIPCNHQQIKLVPTAFIIIGNDVATHYCKVNSAVNIRTLIDIIKHSNV